MLRRVHPLQLLILIDLAIILRLLPHQDCWIDERNLDLDVCWQCVPIQLDFLQKFLD